MTLRSAQSTLLQQNGGSVPVSVKAYGAKGDGVTDDAAAINAAIAALPSTGGIIYFPAGMYAIGSTIDLGNGTSAAISSRQGIYLEGAAGPSPLNDHDIFLSGAAPVVLKWIGAAGGTVVSVNGPLAGWGLKNMCIDGQSVAGIGLALTSAQAGDSHNLEILNCTSRGILSTTVPVFGSVQTDTMHNYWRNVFILVPAAAAAGTMGMLFTGADNTANTCFERYENVYIEISPTAAGRDAFGIYFQRCDNITIRGLHILVAAGQAGQAIPISYDYTANASWPSDTLIDAVDFGAANYAAVAAISGAPATAGPNHVVAISGGNSGGTPPADPSLANLKWNYTTPRAGGVSTQTPGAVTAVTIAHGLGKAPSSFNVNPGDANARGAPASYLTADANNITLNFAAALAAATAYTWVWSASV